MTGFTLDLGEFALVVAGGEDDPRVPLLASKASLVMAADSGAELLLRYGIGPEILVGDFDSCSSAVLRVCRDKGVEAVELPVAKDKTDTEVALDMAVERGFSRVVVAGALGGDRVEHEVANVFLLEAYRRKNVDVMLVSKGTVVFGLTCEKRAFRGHPGDWVSLLPVTRDVENVTTENLKFPLYRKTLLRGSTFGVSNEMESHEASIEAGRGFLLAIVTPRDR